MQDRTMSKSGAIDFPTFGWENDQPGIRSRAGRAEGSRWAIVEYSPGAVRDEWCMDGHRGYVLEGKIEYEFDDGSPPLQLDSGQGFVLAAGTGHRGSNRSDSVTRLFLIDDPD
jgi:quercetin dioxygenase-like cupin family protein